MHGEDRTKTIMGRETNPAITSTLRNLANTMATMDYSDVYKQSNTQCCQFSTDGAYVVNVVGHKLVIRDAQSLHVVSVLTCVDSINAIEFSPDGKYILCACYELGSIQVWDLETSTSVALIEEGICGCARVMWDKYSSRAILSWSPLCIRITVWNLLDGAATVITQPKFIDRGVSFRVDCKYLAILDRVAGKDYICVYACAGYEQCARFLVGTTDADDLAWSPNGRHIAVWDSILDFNVLIYSPEGTLIHTYSPYEYGLGVRNAIWSPSSQFLAVGGYDQKCHLLNHYTFNPILVWSHVSSLILTDKSSVTVFREPGASLSSKNVIGLPSLSDNHQTCPQFEIIMPPQDQEHDIEITFPVVRLDPDQSSKKVGVSMIRWSCNGRFIAIKNDNTPTLVYIYSLKTLNMVAIIQLLAPIKTMEWMKLERNQHRLVICTGSPIVYQWIGSLTMSKENVGHAVAFTSEDESIGEEPTGVVECLGVPLDDIKVQSFAWNPEETQIILMDKMRFCVGFEVNT